MAGERQSAATARLLAERLLGGDGGGRRAGRGGGGGRRRGGVGGAAARHFLAAPVVLRGEGPAAAAQPAGPAKHITRRGRPFPEHTPSPPRRDLVVEG